jgi:hypothetical protein
MFHTRHFLSEQLQLLFVIQDNLQHFQRQHDLLVSEESTDLLLANRQSVLIEQSRELAHIQRVRVVCIELVKQLDGLVSLSYFSRGHYVRCICCFRVVLQEFL